MTTLGRQLMALIWGKDEGLGVAVYNYKTDHVTWQWDKEAEAKINEFLDKHLTKVVREEMCKQLLAVVKNIQELADP